MKSQPGFWNKKSTYCWGLAAILLLFLLVFFQQEIVLAAKEAISGESAGFEQEAQTKKTLDNVQIAASSEEDNAVSEPAQTDLAPTNSEKTLLTESEEPPYGEERKPAKNGLKLETDSTTGAPIYSYPLNMPPGRNGLAPDLKLVYNSQDENNSSVFGYGWSTNIPYIERINRKGVNNLYSENYFYSSLDGELEQIEYGGESMSATGQEEELFSASAAASSSSSLIDELVAAGQAYKKDDGSVELYQMKEEINKRTRNSQTYLVGYTDAGQPVEKGRFYSGEINYYDKTAKQFKEIDTHLVSATDGWQMNKAGYQARIKKNLADNFTTFINGSQEISFSLTSYPKDLITAEKSAGGAWQDRQVIYQNGLGNGIDLAISLNNEAFIKEAVINDLAALGDLADKEYYEIPFKLSANSKIDIEVDGKLLSQEKIITSDKMVEIIDGSGATSYIWPPFVQDSSAPRTKIASIQIRYEIKDDGIYLTKLLPTDWLKTATYPVRTDATVSYYVGTGDGFVTKDNSGDWDTTHNSSSGSTANYTIYRETTADASWFNSTSKYEIYRGFFPFDTSAIPDSAIINGAVTMNFYATGYCNQDQDANNFAVIVETTQATTTSLSTDDFDNCGSTHSATEGSDRIDLDSLGTGCSSYNNYITFTLDATGKSWIDKTGWTKLGMRVGHDINDHAIETGSPYIYNYVYGYYAEQTGTSTDPYLEVTYTTGVAPSAPTDLETEGQTNPTDVTDSSPEFSAIYADDDEGDIATDYQIQVSTSSTTWSNLLWDSGQADLASSTPEGMRIEPIAYASSSPLALDGSTYYWRIRFWDNDNAEGSWSTATSSFTMHDGGGDYGAKADNGNYLKYQFFDSDYWLVTDKKGTQYTFGLATSTIQCNSDCTARYKWMLEETRDANDNYIKYEYYKDSGQIYPSKITYTSNGAIDGIFEIDFAREARNDHATTTAAGFDVTTNYRISEIQAKINGEWTRKYELDYTMGGNGARSLLNAITQSGRDEDGNITALPAEEFSYQAKEESWSQDANWTVPITLENDQARMADVNGDGLPDIIQAEYDSGSRKVYLNDGDGTGWTLDSGWTVSFYFKDSGGNDTGVRLADVNGDGLVDVVNNDDGVLINSGSGWSGNDWTVPVAFNGGESAIVDVNGDGLADIIYAPYNTSSSRKIYLNNGDGWEYDSSWSVPFWLGQSDAWVVELINFADVNGDGLADVVFSISNPSTSNSSVYINNGNGWTVDDNYDLVLDILYSSRIRFTDANGDGLADFIYSYYEDAINNAQEVYINDGDGTGWSLDNGWSVPTYFFQYYASEGTMIDTGVHLADADGDGLIDFVRRKDGDNGDVYINDQKKTDLLARADTSQGATANVCYKGTPEYVDGSGDLLNSGLPLPVETVYQIAENDGLNNIATTTYEYSGGDYYFNDEYDRKFAGFNKIAKTNDLGQVTNNYYHQGNDTASTTGEYSDDISKLGKIYRTEIYDDSNDLYAKTINKWENYDLGNGRDFVKLTQAIDFSYDGDSDHKDKASTYTYDNSYGNLTQSIDWGEVTGSDNGTFTDSGTDLASTTISYAASTTPYIVGLPSQEAIYDQNDSKVKETKYYYDNLSYGNVDKGNLTKQEMWQDNSDYIDIEKTYNTYGLITQEKDPRDKATGYVYDSFNLYVATSTNPLSQATEYYYDYSLGRPDKIIDVNDRQFAFVYDGLDRITAEKQPDLDDPGTLVAKTSYTYCDSSSPRYIKQTSQLDSSASFDVYSFYDGFDRVIQERREAEETNYFSAKDFSYNELGLLAKESLPYFSSGASSTSATADNALYSNYYYDPLGRMATSTNAIATTTIVYDNWQTTITDGEGNIKDLYKDARDNLVQVDEHNGASTYSTYYQYNLLNNLTKITDALGNLRNFTYDGLGRQLTNEDLHAPGDSTYGTTTLSYDDAGNLTSKVDPKEQTINYTYDDINRLLTVDYAGQTGTEASYGYDSCADGIGRLCAATSTDGVVGFNYNALSLVSAKTDKAGATNLTTSYSYDRQGNITLITYPDSSEIKYQYNTAGLPETLEKKIAGETEYSYIIKDLNYNPQGQIIFERFGNNTESFFTYDPGQLYRLTSKLTTGLVDADGLIKMALSNGYSGATPDKDTLLGLDLAYQAADGSINLYEPMELTSERTATSITILVGFDARGKAKYRTKLYASPIHYLDGLSGEYRDINIGLEEQDGYFNLTGAPYGAKLKTQLSDGFLTFINSSQELYFSLVNNPGNLIAAEKSADGAWQGKQVNYDDALGQGIDLSVSFNDNSLIKEAVINDLSALGDLSSREFYEIPFKLTANNKIDLKIDGQLLSQEKIITSDKMAEIIDGSGITSYIWPPFVQDSSQPKPQTAGINIRYELKDDGIYLTKLLPTDWLKAAVYPVRTDATVSYYVGSGDGFVIKYDSGDWDTTHNATSGTTADYTTYRETAASSGWYNPISKYEMYRSFFPFDTSSIPDDATVGSSTLNFYATGICNQDSDGNNFAVLVETDQTATSSLITGDYDNCGSVHSPDQISGQVDLDDLGAGCFSYNNYVSFELNSADIIDKTGWTKLGMREGHDINDHQIITGNPYIYSYVYGYYSEQTGTSTDPYLEVDYTDSSSGSAPTDLLTDSQANPTDLSDLVPSFSAVYNDEEEGDIAIYYQLQLATSTDWANSIWDTGKTAMSSTTEGQRSPDISYTGANLASSTNTYNWRIKFWDDADNPSDWSTPATFDLAEFKNLQNISYTYDKVGNITKIEDESDTDNYQTLDFTYDDLYRLTSASSTYAATTNYLETYTYNAIGNITNKSDVGDYTYTDNGYNNPQAVTSISPTQQGGLSLSFTHDSNGNVTSMGDWDYTWDYRNRLIEATNGTSTLRYGYDHADNRIWAFDGVATTTYVSKYYNVSSTGTSTVNIFANNQLVATIEGNGIATSTYYIHTDHLGGTNVVTDENGAVIQTIDYYPFGEMRINEKETDFDEARKFTGHIFDEKTELNYMVARYQNPMIGNFLSMDPVARDNPEKFLSDPQQLNSYAYSRNNPLRFIDPLGLFNQKTGQIEKGDTLSGITKQINQQYGTSLTYQDLARANGISNPNLIHAGNYITLPKSNLELKFDNKSLQAVDKTYGISYPDLRWNGVSGNKNSSPISEGKWTVDPANTQYWKDVSTPNKIGSTLSPVINILTFGKKEKTGFWPGGTIAWGTVRTELSNSNQQQTGYYIHGGLTPGSAGCIDLTDQNNAFHSWLNSYGKSIDVIVDY